MVYIFGWILKEGKLSKWIISRVTSPGRGSSCFQFRTPRLTGFHFTNIQAKIILLPSPLISQAATLFATLSKSIYIFMYIYKYYPPFLPFTRAYNCSGVTECWMLLFGWNMDHQMRLHWKWRISVYQSLSECVSYWKILGCPAESYVWLLKVTLLTSRFKTTSLPSLVPLMRSN